jgi:hypothetical protein
VLSATKEGIIQKGRTEDRRSVITEQRLQGIGGGVSLLVEAGSTYLYRPKEKPIPDEGDGSF